MESLSAAFDRIEAERKVLEVYADTAALVEDLQSQFASRNVEIKSYRAPTEDEGFLILRTPDDEFAGAMSIDYLRALLAPDIHPPWRLEAPEVDLQQLFGFLENTIFTSFDRRQMLAAAREFEERAWRANSGTLTVGFQRAAAFRAQLDVYRRFATERELTIRIFIDDAWKHPDPDGIDVISEAGGEIGQYWFVLYDGGSSELNACGLLAEERTPDRFYGFWTYDPAFVEELLAYLESTYRTDR